VGIRFREPSSADSRLIWSSEHNTHINIISIDWNQQQQQYQSIAGEQNKNSSSRNVEADAHIKKFN
jgi:hypothetical protein